MLAQAETCKCTLHVVLWRYWWSLSYKVTFIPIQTSFPKVTGTLQGPLLTWWWCLEMEHDTATLPCLGWASCRNRHRHGCASDPPALRRPQQILLILCVWCANASTFFPEVKECPTTHRDKEHAACWLWRSLCKVGLQKRPRNVKSKNSGCC